MDDDTDKPKPPNLKRAKRRRAWHRARPIWLFFLLALLVIVVWLGSISYIRHGLPGTHPKGIRLETLAKIGEAMTITSVLFAGLAFVALIATVWFQRKQIEAMIDGMEEQALHLMDQISRMDYTVEEMRKQALEERRFRDREHLVSGIAAIAQYDISDPGCEQAMRLLNYYSYLALSRNDEDFLRILNTVITAEVRKKLEDLEARKQQETYPYAIEAHGRIKDLLKNEALARKGLSPRDAT
jgi:hypothetical protein